MQVMAKTALASELSRDWRELGGILSSRRLLASLSAGADSRLTPTKLRALDALAEGGGLRVSDLASRMSVDETTATRLADRLEAMGVARRRRDPADRRATEVVLTPSGERLAAEMSKRRLEFFRDVLAALDPAEREELVRLTAKATAAFRARSQELVAR
jgi:DNA-binding MarR family transcriptional regulator